MPFNCEYCGFKVKSKGGLRQHIAGKPNCLAAEKKKAAITMKATMMPKLARPPSSPAASKPTGSSYFVMEKKLQKEASIPTNYHGEMAFDDNFDNDSGPNDRKRKQIRNPPRGPPPKKQHKDVTTGSKRDMILRLPPEKLVQLRKYFEKSQVRDCEVFAQNNEDNGEEAAQSNEDFGQDDDSDSDTSLELVVHYGPDDHYQNPPFV
jgi:hypothetical protein